MELKVVSRARNQRAMRSNILDAIANTNGGSVVSQTDENGVVRMKLVVKKQDLKQMLEVMRGGKNIARQSSPSLSLEQRLNVMRRRHHLRASQVRGTCGSSWRPVLQSIPEELQT